MGVILTIDITPEAVENLCNRIDEWWEYQHGHLFTESASTLRALSAALELSQDETAAVIEAVKVKPLVWVEDVDRDSDTFGSLLSNPMIGGYYRIDRGIGGQCRGSWSLQRYDTLDDAITAAQADHDTRILSAIDTPHRQQGCA